jgi:hypothetical protein
MVSVSDSVLTMRGGAEMKLAVLFPNGYKSPISEDQVAKYGLKAGMLTPYTRLPIVAL